MVQRKEEGTSHWQQRLARLRSSREQLQLLSREIGFGRQRSWTQDVRREFQQYRPYQGGDPVALVDWRRYARQHELLVKQGDSESQASLFFFVDFSETMGEQSLQHANWSKLSFAKLLVGFLALKAAEGSLDWAMADLYQQSLLQDLSTGPRQFNQCLQILDHPPKIETSAPLRSLLARFLGFSLFIVDGLQDPESMLQLMSALPRQGSSVSKLLIILETEAERKAVFDFNQSFVDRLSVAVQPRRLKSEQDRQTYLENRSRHFTKLNEKLAVFACPTIHISIDDDIPSSLHQILALIARYSR